MTTSIGSLRERIFAVAVLCMVLGTLPAFAGPGVASEEEGNHATIGTFVEEVVDGWLGFFRGLLWSVGSADPSSEEGLQPLNSPTVHENDGGPIGGMESPQDHAQHNNDGGPVG